MAERPVFVPAPDAPGFVREKNLVIKWAGGFAVVQKKKNVKALHEAAEAIGIGPVLEASTKSDEKLGQHLSSFHLKVETTEGALPLECVYQGSKVFERGGPYTDLYFIDPRSAKRDSRLQESGRLIAFVFEGHEFPLEPKTVFYDWLYIRAIFPHRAWLDRLSRYAAFSDIEFNPQKSINCQARALALFVSLKAASLLDDAVRSPESFIEIMRLAGLQPSGTEMQAPVLTNSPPEQPKSVVAIGVGMNLSPKVSTEPSMTADPKPVAFPGQAIEDATLPASNLILESSIPQQAAPRPALELRSIPPDFETFLREKALRKPINPGQKRNKKVPEKPKKSPQTSAFEWL